MHLQFSPFTVPLLAAALCNAAVSLYALRRRTVVGAISLSWFTLAVAFWSLGYLFELAGTDMATKIFWSGLSFIGIVSAPLAFLAFAFEVAGLRSWLTWRKMALFCLVPLLTLGLVWTSRWHPWFWSSIELRNHGSYSALEMGFGPGFYLHTGYHYLLLTIGSVLILRKRLGAPRILKGRKVFLLVSLLLPWIAGLSHLLRLLPGDPFDPTPFAFTLTGLGLAWGGFGFRLFGFTPLARQLVMEHLEDGVLLLDGNGRLVDYNPAAEKILQPQGSQGQDLLPQDWIGQPATELLSPWPSLQALLAQEAGAPIEWSPVADPFHQSFDVRVSPIYDRLHSPVGRAMIFHEITGLKQAEASFQRHTAYIESLNQVILTAAQAEELLALLAAVLDQVLNTLHLEMGSIRLYESQVNNGLQEEMLPALAKLNDLQAPDHPQVIKIEDWTTVDDQVSQAGLRALLLVPMTIAEQTAGYLVVFSVTPRAWSAEEEALLSAVVHQLELAAERLLSVKRAQSHAGLVSKLVLQDELLDQSLSEKDVTAAIVRGAKNLVNADRAEVMLVSAGQGLEASESPTQPRPVLIPDVRLHLQKMEDSRQLEQTLDYQAMAVWPLVSQGQTLAILRCYYDHPYHWSAIEEEVMQAFSRQAAIALRSARLSESEHRQRQLAETMRELASDLPGTLNLEEVLKKVLLHLSQILPFDLANVLLVEKDRVRLLYSLGSEQSAPQVFEAALVRDLDQIPGLKQMQTSREPFLLPDCSQDEAWMAFWQPTTARSYLAAPVLHQGEMVAVINLFSRQPHGYQPAHAASLAVIARQAEVAVQNAYLYSSLQIEAAESSALYRALSKLINPGNEVASIAEQITQAIASEFTTAYSSVMLLDEREQMLQVIAWAGYAMENTRLPLDGPGLTVAAVHSGQPLYAPDVRQDQRYLAGAALTRSELVLPLCVREKVIGVLNLERPEPDGFDERSRRVMAVFADHAALALENALLLRTSNLRMRQLNLLNEITQITLTAPDQDILLQQLANRMRELFDADDCFFTLWDEKRRQVFPGVDSGQVSPFYSETVPESGESTLTLQVMESKSPLVVEDVSNSALVSPHIARTFGFISLLGIPLVAGEQKFGSAILGYRQPHYFPQQEITLAEQAGAQVALALAKVRSLELSLRRAREADNLREATGAIAQAQDLGTILNSILSHLARVIQYDSAAVFLIEGTQIRMVSVIGPPSVKQLEGQTFSSDNALVQVLITTQKALIIPDAQADSRFESWGDARYIRGWLGVPLISRGQTIGLLTIDSRQVGAFDQEQGSLAQAFANQAAVAIEKARLFSEVQELAATDPLTGLYNRRGYTEIGQREVERARRYNHPLSVIMLDIDHFKQINDRYKHSIGDQVLFELARRCSERLREIDIVGRYGGEEIVLLLPETDHAGALKVAEALRLRVAEQPFKTQVGPLSLTISMGIAVFTGGPMDLATLIDRADDAMYAAKQAGRNQIKVYELPTG